MPEEKQTLGRAIDQILEALDSLDDSARKTALSAVCAHLNIELPSSHRTTGAPQSTPTAASSPPVLTPTLSQAPLARIDIRALRETKKPTSVKQMACLVGYYLKELAPDDERKDAIGASELEKYFKQAGFRLPKAVQQVLPDAKSAGYFDSAGRGEYRLNAVGHNLVVHNLPPGSADT